MRQFTLSITDLRHGWMTVCVLEGEQSYTFQASYLADTPYYLALSTSALLDNVENTTLCFWQDEPGEHRWIAERISSGSVTLKIIWLPETFSHRDHEEGKIVFSCECTKLRLATQIKGQLLKLRNTYGIDGYADAWQHDFPQHLLDFLARFVGR